MLTDTHRGIITMYTYIFHGLTTFDLSQIYEFVPERRLYISSTHQTHTAGL